MDIRNKLPFYVSDFTDCLNLQCVASTVYLYLVCLCSVVAFGGMLGTATENYMVRRLVLSRRSRMSPVVFSRRPWSVSLLDALVTFSRRCSPVNR